jgi:hypothetical protein
MFQSCFIALFSPAKLVKIKHFNIINEDYLSPGIQLSTGKGDLFELANRGHFGGFYPNVSPKVLNKP